MSKRVALPSTFRRIWSASAVSALGDGIYLSALPLLALSLTHSPVLLSTVEAAALVPWLLFGLIGGALVDRWNRRRTMWLTDLCRACLLGVVTVGVAEDVVDIYGLIAVAFLLGIGQILFDTAGMAYLPELLERDPENLQRANARLQATQTAGSGFVGPPTGSVLFGLGRAVPVAGDALSFLFSSLTIRSLPAATAAKPTAPKGSLLKDARAGASYLIHHKLLLAMALRPAVGNFAFAGISAILVLFARDTLHLTASEYGLLLTTEAVGGLAGAAVATRLSGWLGTGGTLTLTAVVESLSILGIAVSRNAIEAGASFAVCGMAMAATMVLGPSIRQAIVPNELMGRVGAAGRIVALCAAPLGAVVGGWLASTAGLRAPFYVGAGVLGVMAVVVGRMTSNKRIDAALAEARVRTEVEAAVVAIV